ncbi:disease resistance protein At4g27190-like [Magnolia sinica]|uniref:disease resistance protein At4g27190-like n=1 Tax=Magnolia sinica TaxID=86752 RepID=UPI002658E8A8|nr:disease resistance protein At4g27190-like [Magnolia sinica]
MANWTKAMQRLVALIMERTPPIAQHNVDGSLIGNMVPLSPMPLLQCNPPLVRVLEEIARNAWVQYDYSRRLEESLDVLKTEMRELSNQEADVKNELNIAKVMHGKKLKAEVSLWLKNVQKTTSEVTKIEEDSREVGRDFSLSRVALGKLVVKKIDEVVKLKEKEDYLFTDEELIKYWIADGLINDMGGWEKELDKGQTILNGLIDACMLVRRFGDSVVMHDLVRDLAIGITRKSPQFVVKIGKGIRGSIGVEAFTEEVEKISLTRNEIEMLSDQPNCPKLSTLLLRDNPLLGNISDEFFNRMNSLRVLDLSKTGIEYLPESVSNLENLYMLLLNSCKRLREDEVVPIGDNSIITPLLSIRTLFLMDLPKFMGMCEGVLVPPSFACLKLLTVWRCQVLENVFSLELFQYLQCLESISIEECSEMEEVIKGGEEGYNNNNKNTIILLPNLRELHLINLGKLKSVCKRVIICPSLNAISIEGCHQLKRIPLYSGNSKSFVEGDIYGSKEWWDALEWDDPNTKTLLLPLFIQVEEQGHRILKRNAEEVEEPASTTQHQ